MRRMSFPARRAVNAPETDEVFVALLVINDVGIDGPLRFCNNVESIFSKADDPDALAQEYLGWPFGLALPDERDDQITGIRLEIDNVDPRIIQAVRPLTVAPLLRLYIVLARSPDLIEAGPIEGRVDSIDYNAQTISATLRGPQVLAEPFPGRTFIPSEWPALF